MTTMQTQDLSAKLQAEALKCERLGSQKTADLLAEAITHIITQDGALQTDLASFQVIALEPEGGWTAGHAKMAANLANQAIRRITAHLHPVDPLVEEVTISIAGRGESVVSIGELSRLIKGGARITSIQSRGIGKEVG